MIAYKFLRAGGVGRFSGFAWPLPRGDAPGAWVTCDDQATCQRGVHACEPRHMPGWLDEELYRIELGGAITEAPLGLCASRGRLLSPVEAWPAAAEEFNVDCVGRARARLSPALPEAVRRECEALLADLDSFAVQPGRWATVSYVAADLARRAAGADQGQAAFLSERDTQARWLARLLSI